MRLNAFLRRYGVVAIVALSLTFATRLLTQSTLNPPTSGTWSVSGPMSQARAGASSALLVDGRVLVSGGSDGSGPASTAEVFSLGGFFSQLPPMATPRQNHVSVTLIDGRVLVAGGATTGGGITNAAEIYDPNSNSWTNVAGGMVEARSGATVTLLQDGRVLIAGGQNPASAVSATLEIFDPATNTFTLAGMALSSPRANHAAALLKDGRVLIVGGTNGDPSGAVSLSSSDIFDPSNNSVTPGPQLATARAGASATTLLDGTVLVAGGNNGTSDLASAEIFSPATGAFSSTGSLSGARSGHLAFLLPNNYGVLITGGTFNGAPLAISEVYRTPYGTSAVPPGSFSPSGTLTSGRTQAAGTPLLMTPGALLVAGGTSDGITSLSRSELYGFPTAKTDQTDYPPGTMVTITGSGFKPGEAVALQLLESPLIDTHGPYNVTADANGNISDSSFVTDAHDLNVRFYLTATGAVSGSIAQTTFTDAGATKLGFTTSVFNVMAGLCSPQITLQTENAGNVATTPTNTETITLSSTSGGSFYSDASCSTLIPSNRVTISTSASSASFFYGNTTVGNGTITATPSPVLGTAPTQTEGVLKLVITTAPTSVVAGACSTTINLQTQTSGGTATAPWQAVQVGLSTSSNTGTFSNASDCSNSIGNISMGQGNTTLTGSLFYKDGAVGTPTITVEGGSTQPTHTITVTAGAFSKLQLLVPGETAAPGTSTGKTGTPTVQTGTLPFNVTVNSVDANWNPVSSTDTIHIASSDAAATLPVNAALVAGAKAFSVSLNTVGTATITASDVTSPSKTANTSPSITVTSLNRTWNGSVSTDWTNNGNWDEGLAPTSNNVAIIPAGKPQYPIISTGSQTASSLQINSGGSLTITGGSLAVGKSGVTGSVVIGGTLDWSGGTLTVTGGATMPLTVNSGGLFRLRSGTNGMPAFTSFSLDANSTVEYGGTSQPISGAASAYGNLSTSGSNTKTLGAATTINGNLSIGAGTTLDISASNFAVALKGNWSNSGTFTPRTGTVSLTGSSAQSIGGSVDTTFSSLIVNNTSGGITLQANVAVSGTLTLTSGIIDAATNGKKVTIAAGGTAPSGSSASYVSGQFAEVFTGPGVVKNFPVGKGGNFRATTLGFTALTGTSTVAVEQFESGFLGTAPANVAVDGTRYWQVTQTGGSNFTYRLTLDSTGLSFTDHPALLEYDSGTTLLYAGSPGGGLYQSGPTGTGLSPASSFAFADILATTIGNGTASPDGTYFNAANMANTLAFTNVSITDNVKIIIGDDIDLSTSAFGQTAGNLLLTAPTLDLTHNVKFGLGSIGTHAGTVNLNGTLTGCTVVTPCPQLLLGGSRLTGTATVVNVLSSNANLQQAIDLTSTTTPDTINVAAGQYSGNLTINKSLTLHGDPGDTLVAGPGPSAPQLMGTVANGTLIGIAASNVTINGLLLNAQVSGGSLSNSNTGISGSGSNITIRDNTFSGFSQHGVDFSSSSNLDVEYNIFTSYGITPIQVAGGSGATIANNVFTYPTPFINGINPLSAAPGGSSFTLTVKGTGLINGTSTIDWNGVPLAGTTCTSAVSPAPAACTATVPSGDITTAGTAGITVVNPATAPATGVSNVVFSPVTTSTAAVAFNRIDQAIGHPSGIAMADFNRDGKMDVAVADQSANTVSVLLGNGDGTFTLKSTSATGLQPFSVAVGDFNGDGIPDLAVGNITDGHLTILLGNGDGTFTAAPTPPASLVPSAIAVADFNSDGKLDLAVTNGNTNGVRIWLGNGDGTFTAGVTLATLGAFPNSIAVGDFDGDGTLDLAIAMANGNTGNTMNVYLGNGDGTFRAASSSPSEGGTKALYVAAADLNGDGKLDLAVVFNLTNTVKIFLGNGDGTFTDGASLSTGTGTTPVSLVIGDLNGDGKPDIAVLDQTASNVSVFLGNGDGTFAAAAPIPSTGSTPAFFVMGDLNGDGRLDLITTNINGHSISVLLQTGDLTASLADDVGGATTFPNGWNWTLTASNGIGGTDTFAASQTILVDNLPNANIGYGSPSIVNPTGVSGTGTISCAIGGSDNLTCTASGGTVTLAPGASFGVKFSATPTAGGTFANPRATGSCAVDPQNVIAETNEGNNTCSDSVTVTVSSSPTTTMVGTSLTPSVFGQSVTFTATVSSGSGTPTGTVNFFDASAGATCSVLGSSVQIGATQTLISGSASVSSSALAIATHTILACYTHTGTFLDSSGTVTQVITQVSQTITITQDAPASANFNSSFTVIATGGASGNAISFGLVANSACTITSTTATSSTVKITSGTGTCQLTLDQAGNGTYTAAVQITGAQTTAQTIAQTITFAQPTSPATYNTTFGVSPTSDSGLTVTVMAAGGCSISSGTVTMTSGTTTCTLTASQAGNTNFSAATNVIRMVSAALATQATLNVTGPSTLTYNGTPVTVTASGGSGTGSLTFSSGASNGCSVSGNQVSVTNASSTCMLSASMASDGNYKLATSSALTVTLVKASLTITPDSSKIKTVGSTFTAFTGMVSGLVSPDAVTVTYTSTGAPSSAAVGSYNITGSSVMFTTGSASNYSITENTAVNGLTVNPGPPVQLAFTTLPFTATAGQCSSSITVTAEDFLGNPTSVGALPLTVSLSSNSTGTASFFGTAADCGNNANAVTNAMIPGGQATSPAFYYRDTKSGTPTITASSSLTNPTQQETINAAAASQLAIATAPFTLVAGGCSATNTVISEDQFGNTSNVAGTVQVDLSTASAGGKFYSDAACQNLIPVNNSKISVSIASGTSSAGFFYADTVPGTVVNPTTTITTADDAAILTHAIQAETILHLVFTTSSFMVSQGACLGPVTVTAENAGNVATPLTVAADLALTSSSSGGAFFSGSGCATASSGGTISATGNNFSFSYKDSGAGNPTLTATIGAYFVSQQETVGTPPSIISANSTTFTVTSVGTFSVTASGSPTPSLSVSASLPSGVTFQDNGNGTATISGTPALGTVTAYPVTITANNGVSPNAIQAFTLTVQKFSVTASVAGAGTTYDGTSKTVVVNVTPTSAQQQVIVTYTSNSPSYNSTTGPTNAGTYTATATLSDTSDYQFTNSTLTGTLTIGQKMPAITFGTAPSPTYLSGPFSVIANSDSDGALTYSYVSGPCTQSSGGMFNSTGAGTCVVKAGTVATANFLAGSNTQSVIIGKAGQSVVTVTAPANLTYGATATATATGGSGTGGYTFGAGSSTGCSVTGTTVSITLITGTCSLTAIRVGDANFTDSAASAAFGVTLHKATLIVTVDNKSMPQGTTVPTLTGTLTGVIVGDGISVTYSTTATSASPAATYPITATLHDPNIKLGNYSVTNTPATMMVTLRPTTIKYTGVTTGVYGICNGSNMVSAQLIDNLSNSGIVGASVTITVGTQTVTLVTGANGTAQSSLTLTQSTGPISANATFAGDLIHAGSATNNTNNFTITSNTNVGPLTGQPLYTGLTFFWTTSATSGTATLTLSATVEDNSAPCHGDIRTAKVTFAIRNADGSLSPLSNGQNLPVGLVDPSDTTVGTASAITQYNLGSASSNSFEIAVTIGGNYTRNVTADDTIIGVAVPGIANSMAGVGELDNTLTPASSGYLASNPVSGANYYTSVAANVQFNKSLTNVQGKVNILVKSGNKPDGSMDTSVHTYLISSNSISGMTETQDPKTLIKTVSFGAKANVTDITNPAALVGVDSGTILQLVFTSANGTPQQSGYVPQMGSVVVQRKAGGTWYSSAWDGTKTVQKVLAGGTVSIQ